jgi:hypothetical protein
MGAAMLLARVAEAVLALASEWVLPCMVAAALVPVLACKLCSLASALLGFQCGAARQLCLQAGTTVGHSGDVALKHLLRAARSLAPMHGLSVSMDRPEAAELLQQCCSRRADCCAACWSAMCPEHVTV